MFKLCNQCNETKNVDNFSINKTLKNGNIVYKSKCKECRCLNEKNKRLLNLEKYKEKDKKYYDTHKEAKLKSSKNYNEKNKEELQIKKKEYYNKNKEIIKEYHNNNKEKRNIRLRNRTKTDKLYAITCSLRTRLYETIKNKDNMSYSKIIKTSTENLINWFDYQFNENMNWDNYGKYWNIDHVIPMSYFNLENKLDRDICLHWTNLRPLNSIENTEKSNKIDKNIIMSHVQIIKLFVQLNKEYQSNYENSWWQRIELWNGNNFEDDLSSLLFVEDNEMDNSQPSS
jgi:hypothetical protein